MSRVFCLIVFISLFSCKNKDKKYTESDYKKLFYKYESMTKKNYPFNKIVDSLFYKPKELMKDTVFGSFYFFNAVNHSFVSNYLSEKENVFNYYWNDEIQQNTDYSFFIDTLCDCNLVLEYANKDKFIPICFYKGKIYSIEAPVINMN